MSPRNMSRSDNHLTPALSVNLKLTVFLKLDLSVTVNLLDDDKYQQRYQHKTAVMSEIVVVNFGEFFR